MTTSRIVVHGGDLESEFGSILQGMPENIVQAYQEMGFLGKLVDFLFYAQESHRKFFENTICLLLTNEDPSFEGDRSHFRDVTMSAANVFFGQRSAGSATFSQMMFLVQAVGKEKGEEGLDQIRTLAGRLLGMFSVPDVSDA